MKMQICIRLMWFCCSYAGADSPLIVDTLLGLATAYNDMDESTSAIEVYNRIVSIIEKTRGPTDETLALPLSRLGQCLLDEERVDEAETALQRLVIIIFGLKHVIGCFFLSFRVASVQPYLLTIFYYLLPCFTCSSFFIPY